MPTTSPRLGLDITQSTDAVSGFPTADAQAKGILDNAVIYAEGTLAARPAAAVKGRVYHATDTGAYYWDTGSAWLMVIIAGAWQALTLNTGIGAAIGTTPSARIEGDTVRLKGGLQNTSGSTISTGVVLATIPSGYHPLGNSEFPVAQFVSGGPQLVNYLSIGVGGDIEVQINSMAAGSIIGLDGITFTLS